jgi:hypothetical protein
MNGRKQLWVFFIVVAISLAMPTGVSAIGMPQDAQEVANATGPNWSPRGPLPRNGHSAVLDTVKNKMIVFGGSTFSSDAPPSAHFNDVWYPIRLTASPLTKAGRLQKLREPLPMLGWDIPQSSIPSKYKCPLSWMAEGPMETERIALSWLDHAHESFGILPRG